MEVEVVVECELSGVVGAESECFCDLFCAVCMGCGCGFVADVKGEGICLVVVGAF